MSLWKNPNPFENLERLTVKSDPTNLSYDELRRFVRAIPLDTVQGWRDLCIVAGPIILGRRLSEWLPLRRCDVHDVDTAPWFTYTTRHGAATRSSAAIHSSAAPHGSARSQPMPFRLWAAIQRYLTLAKRWPLAPNAYIFTALSASILNLSHIHVDYKAEMQSAPLPPLSQRTVNQSLKVYARKGHIDIPVNARVLWRSGIMLRRQRGASVLELHELLDHVNVAVTRSALARMTCDPDAEAIFDQVVPAPGKLTI